MLRRHHLMPLAERRVLDVGCGDGSVLRDLVRYGASPRYLEGVDLLPERIRRARELSPGIRFSVGDAQALPYPDGAFDLTLAFTLLSSVIDGGGRRRVAEEAMRVLRPGGALLLYDFWLNPGNPDVRPLRAGEIRRLFSGHEIDLRRVTLAPPITRAVARWSWLLCEVLEKVPVLRTHYLAAVIKRSD
jgi:SAM-dependent methyltransferase